MNGSELAERALSLLRANWITQLLAALGASLRSCSLSRGISPGGLDPKNSNSSQRKMIVVISFDLIGRKGSFAIPTIS
jgi:hypothetical protein